MASLEFDNPCAGAADLGVYVHVPYCKSICPYCDFNSYVDKSPPWARFADSLVNEYRARLPDYIQDTARTLRSVYFGGGTPSLAPGEFFTRMLAEITAPLGGRHDESVEITAEVNPGTVDKSKFEAMRHAGVNRISLGFQSTHDRLLKVLGRGHSAADSLSAYALAREAGFRNISVDLIFAVPGQDMTALQADLDALKRLQPEHVSLYALTYHQGTPFFRWKNRGRLKPVEDDLEAEMMHHIEAELTGVGFEHYEVSNYAMPKHRAVHNSLYWTGSPYLGIGPGAHSFLHRNFEEGWRWESVRDPNRHMAAWQLPQVETELDSPHGDWPGEYAAARCVEWGESLTARQLLAERMMCAARLQGGIDLSMLRTAAFAAYAPTIEGAVEQAVQQDWARLQGSWFVPTRLGLRHADALGELFF